MPAMYGSVVRSTYDRTRRILEPVARRPTCAIQPTSQTFTAIYRKRVADPRLINRHFSRVRLWHGLNIISWKSSPRRNAIILFVSSRIRISSSKRFKSIIQEYKNGLKYRNFPQFTLRFEFDCYESVWRKNFRWVLKSIFPISFISNFFSIIGWKRRDLKHRVAMAINTGWRRERERVSLTFDRMKRDPFCGTTTMRAVNQVAGPHGHKHRICHPVLSFCALFNPILSAMGRVADAAQPPPNGQLQLLCKIVARVVVLLPF